MAWVGGHCPPLRHWWAVPTLHEKHAGFFEDLFEGAQKFGGDGAVDDSMVGAEGGGENCSGDDLVFADHGALLGRTDGENSDFGGIDDGAELADTVGAE